MRVTKTEENVVACNQQIVHQSIKLNLMQLGVKETELNAVTEDKRNKQYTVALTKAARDALLEDDTIDVYFDDDSVEQWKIQALSDEGRLVDTESRRTSNPNREAAQAEFLRKRETEKERTVRVFTELPAEMLLLRSDSDEYQRCIQRIKLALEKTIQLVTVGVERFGTIALESANTDTPTHKLVTFMTLKPTFAASREFHTSTWELLKYLQVDGFSRLLKSRIKPTDLEMLGKRRPCCFRRPEECEERPNTEGQCKWQDEAYGRRRAERGASSGVGYYRELKEQEKRDRATARKRASQVDTAAQLRRVVAARREPCAKWSIGQCSRVVDPDTGIGCRCKHGPAAATAKIPCAEWEDGANHVPGFKCGFHVKGLQCPYANNHQYWRGTDRERVIAQPDGAGPRRKSREELLRTTLAWRETGVLHPPPTPPPPADPLAIDEAATAGSGSKTP